MNGESNHRVASFLDVLRGRVLEDAERPVFTFLRYGETELATWTYYELGTLARSMTARLQTAGSVMRDRGLLLFEFIAPFLGGLYADVVAVPAYPPRRARAERGPAVDKRLQVLVRGPGPRFILTDTATAVKRRALAVLVHELDVPSWMVVYGVGKAAAWRVEPRFSGETLAFQYTSGSTSDLKGVMVTHPNLLHNEEAICRTFGMSADSVVVGWLPLYRYMGLIGVAAADRMEGGLSVGAMSESLAGIERKHEVLCSVYSVEGNEPVHWVLPPSRRFLPVVEFGVLREPVRRREADRWAVETARLPFDFAHAPVFRTVLLREGEGSLVLVHSYQPAGERSPVLIGRPLANVTAHMVDRDLRPLPLGVPGELCLGGISLAGGYLGRPELRAERFVPDPNAEWSGAWLYRRGDLARWQPRGTVEYLGLERFVPDDLSGRAGARLYGTGDLARWLPGGNGVRRPGRPPSQGAGILHQAGGDRGGPGLPSRIAGGGRDGVHGRGGSEPSGGVLGVHEWLVAPPGTASSPPGVRWKEDDLAEIRRHVLGPSGWGARRFLRAGWPLALGHAANRQIAPAVHARAFPPRVVERQDDLELAIATTQGPAG
jgi:acyl-CoA synthetase (AMP-forming)/AMP-acid ligase II